jgi:hypothetical protein
MADAHCCQLAQLPLLLEQEAVDSTCSSQDGRWQKAAA